MTNTENLIATICELPIADRYIAINAIKTRFIEAGNARDYDLQSDLESLLAEFPVNMFSSTFRIFV